MKPDNEVKTAGGENPPAEKKNLVPGIAVFLTSRLCWVVAFCIVPFLALSFKHKAIGTSVFFAFAEIFFYVGLFMLGKEGIKIIKERIHPKNWKSWFKKKKTVEETTEIIETEANPASPV
ncbi:MAG: transporter suffix domain-containing protein [Firmicutes bacterium]|nr:transporter suffix domain-containing protein [Bacillota bacterium]